MEIRRRRSGRLPCGIKPRFAWPFNSVKIHSPARSGIKSLNQRLHRQRQLCNPRLAGFIQCHPPSQLAFQIVFFARCDVQINPHPVRTDFEFLVAPSIRFIWLKKNLSHVSIPQLITPSVGLGVRKNCDHAVLRPESQIERLPCPKQMYFRLPLGIGILPLPVGLKSKAASLFPRRQVRKTLRTGPPTHSSSNSGPLIRSEFVFSHRRYCTWYTVFQNSDCDEIHKIKQDCL